MSNESDSHIEQQTKKRQSIKFIALFRVYFKIMPFLRLERKKVYGHYVLETQSCKDRGIESKLLPQIFVLFASKCYCCLRFSERNHVLTMEYKVK